MFNFKRKIIVRCIIVVLAFAMPVIVNGQSITSFSPTSITAGTESILTINGTNFGTAVGSVLFKNADNGGGTYITADNSEIISWTSTRITIKVPQDASTGQISVKVSSGTQVYSSGSLTIRYAVMDGSTTSGYVPIRIVNDNGSGGYTFQMETSFDANTAAKASFKRAFDSWKCATNVNWVIGATTTVNQTATDDINVIKFGGDGEIEAGTLGYTLSSWRKCANGKWELADVDMVFNNRDYSWNYATTNPTVNQYDFETVALHELGHVHSLNHVNNPADPMHYSIRNGTTNRVLSATDVEGGLFVINYSLTPISGACTTPMVPLPAGSCSAPIPTITSFTPTSAVSGTTVTITGTNFTNAMSVSFGGVPAASFNVVSATTITAVVASGATGNVVVTTSGGVATAAGFTFLAKLPQTLIATSLPAKTYGDSDFDPGVTASSGLPVTYTSSNPLVATIVNNKVHIVGAGTTMITAAQAGNATYSAATSVNLTLVVNKANQTISFPAIAAKLTTDLDFDPGATSSSGLPITYTSSNTAVAILINSKIHIVGGGTTIITATQAGNTNYNAAANVSVNLTVNKFQQVITFPEIGIKSFSEADFDPGATSSAGLPITYSSANTNIATIVNNKVHIVGVGSVSITASQSGNANYNAAADVSRTLIIIFNLPANNFSVKATDETCKTSDNGSIDITAAQALAYTATVTGNSKTTVYQFTTTLQVANLQAGTYNVCFTLASQPSYKQCFDVVIKEPKDLAVYSSLKNDGNTVVLKLEGSDSYTINLNGQILTTTQQEITLPLIKGNNNIKISSDKSCQGIIEKTFITTNEILVYPNPVKDVLNINTGSTEFNTAKVEIHALDGRLIKSGVYSQEYGRLTVDVSQLQKGLYILTLTVGKSKTAHRIIKD